jgi:ABC-type Fe3+-hydroxamate transport system substrate-binding protein
VRGWAAAALLGLACASGCGGEPPGLRGDVRDDAGRVLRLDRAPERIVSLSPSITELLFAIGAGERVVGRTRWCADPPDALAVPSVGDGLAPNVELVIARRPDLVLFYRSPSNAAAIARLDALGIATASLALDDLRDFGRDARLVGRLTGRVDRADSLLARLAAELDGLPPAATHPPRVLVLTWDQPPIVIGRGSFLSELVGLAGGVNAFDDLAQPSAPVTLEAIAARDPDLVLLASGAEPAFISRPEWQAVRAVRERRFVRVTGTMFGYPSFRAPEAVRALRTALEGLR